MTVNLLPERTGPRPATRPHTPHQQLNQNAPGDIQDELWLRMLSLKGVSPGQSGVSLPSTKALHLDEEGAADAFLIGREFAHLHEHSDGSMHMVLQLSDVAEAIEKGWAEPHPLVKAGVLPENLVMVYGPRDREELETVWGLIERSYAYATGTL